MAQLPPEIWEMILSNVSHDGDLRNVSMVCTTFHGMVMGRLWESPMFKAGMLAENLFKIRHLPIRKLDTRNFYKLSGQEWVEDGEKVLEGISQINDLETLEVEDVRYTEAIMGKLCAMKNLKRLTLYNLWGGEKIANAMHDIKTTDLESLHIPSLRYIEPVCKVISAIASLKELEIETNDLGCRDIANLPNLEVLIIRHSELTEEGMNHLKRMTTLKKVVFDQCYHHIAHKVHILQQANPVLEIHVKGVPPVVLSKDFVVDMAMNIEL